MQGLTTQLAANQLFQRKCSQNKIIDTARTHTRAPPLTHYQKGAKSMESFRGLAFFHSSSCCCCCGWELTALVEVLDQVTRPQIASLVAQQGVHDRVRWSAGAVGGWARLGCQSDFEEFSIVILIISDKLSVVCVSLPFLSFASVLVVFIVWFVGVAFVIVSLSLTSLSLLNGTNEKRVNKGKGVDVD